MKQWESTIVVVYAMGSLIRGVLWETTAVPELRVQAGKVANAVMQEVKLATKYAHLG